MNTFRDWITKILNGLAGTDQICLEKSIYLVRRAGWVFVRMDESAWRIDCDKRTGTYEHTDHC